jgi:hypothetical protein
MPTPVAGRSRLQIRARFIHFRPERIFVQEVTFIKGEEEEWEKIGEEQME